MRQPKKVRLRINREKASAFERGWSRGDLLLEYISNLLTKRHDRESTLNHNQFTISGYQSPWVGCVIGLTILWDD